MDIDAIAQDYFRHQQPKWLAGAQRHLEDAKQLHMTYDMDTSLVVAVALLAVAGFCNASDTSYHCPTPDHPYHWGHK